MLWYTNYYVVMIELLSCNIRSIMLWYKNIIANEVLGFTCLQVYFHKTRHIYFTLEYGT